MDCSVDFATFTKGLQPLHGGSTSSLYFSNEYVAKRVTKYTEHGPFAREICLLERLRPFGWSPKLFCVGADYFVTKNFGQSTASCKNYPSNYSEQIDRIVRDMESVGVRHNDMLKGDKTDIVIDSNGVAHLTDFGWGTLNNSLALRCRVHDRVFESPGTRPRNPVLDGGFANANERHHTDPCRHVRRTPFVSFRQRGGQGSQQEIPRINVDGSKVVVSGYQNFELTPTDLEFRGHAKYSYLQTQFTKLVAHCGTACRFLDIGSNTGLVSFIAERDGFAHVQALDHDGAAIDVVQKAAKAVHSKVDGRVFSFGDALPEADVVFCGALIHWVFCLTADFKGDFLRIVQYLAKAARRHLVIEWVDPLDPAIKTFHHIQRCGGDAAHKYSRDAFTNALRTIGHIIDEATFKTRTLFTLLVHSTTA